jgi:cytochrome c-type biogenesis protein CcmH
MRSSIEQRLRAGETPDQIRAFFVQRYGEWVLLEPPRRGFDLVPWLAPIAALALGLWLWVRSFRRSHEVEGASEEVSA